MENTRYIACNLWHHLGLKLEYHVLVVEVMQGSSAEIAGIRPNDIVVEFDDKKVNSDSTLLDMVAKTPPGTKVKVCLNRGGQTMNVIVTIGPLQEDKQNVDIHSRPAQEARINL